MSMHGLKVGKYSTDISRRLTPLDLVNDDEPGVIKETGIKFRINNPLHLVFDVFRVFDFGHGISEVGDEV
jgi:hypothetical protein